MNTKSSKKQFPIVLAGAGRGGQANLSAFKQFNNEAIKAELLLGIIDPVSGRAETLATKAMTEGIKAIGGEEHIEDIVFEGGICPPIVTAIDTASDNAQTIRNAEESLQTVIGQLLVKTNEDDLFALRFHLRHKDKIARLQTLALLDAMSRISERKGGESVWGEEGRTEHRLLEPVFRENYAQSLARDLRKTLFHLEPECSPLEISFDGKTVYPLIVETNPRHLPPEELLDDLPSHLYLPFGRGDSLVVAEIVGNDIGLQKVSRRRSDGCLVLSDIADTTSIAQADGMQSMIDRYREEQVNEEKARLQARLNRSSLSLSKPITTTD